MNEEQVLEELNLRIAYYRGIIKNPESSKSSVSDARKCIYCAEIGIRISSVRPDITSQICANLDEINLREVENRASAFVLSASTRGTPYERGIAQNLSRFMRQKNNGRPINSSYDQRLPPGRVERGYSGKATKRSPSNSVRMY